MSTAEALTIATAFAEAERDRIRECITQTKRDQRARGRYVGGRIPFGYRVGNDGSLIEDPAEQIIVSRARGLRAKSQSFRSIQVLIEAEFGQRLSLDTHSRIVSGHDDRVAPVWPGAGSGARRRLPRPHVPSRDRSADPDVDVL